MIMPRFGNNFTRPRFCRRWIVGSIHGVRSVVLSDELEGDRPRHPACPQGDAGHSYRSVRRHNCQTRRWSRVGGGSLVLARLRLLFCAGRSLSGCPPAIPPGCICLPNWIMGRRIVRLVFGCGSFSPKRHQLMNSSNNSPEPSLGTLVCPRSRLTSLVRRGPVHGG